MREMDRVFKEVQLITQKLVQCGLAEDYNFPDIQKTDIIWMKYKDISQYLKNLDYASIYREIEKTHNYNFKLPDGGMIQLMYRFDGTGKELLAHRLAFYPSPSFEIYQNNAEIYNEDSLYGDVINKEVLPVVIRADFNRDIVQSTIHHPYSHITLGGYKNCRIPADKPISPVSFIKFIMEHFYYVPSAVGNFDINLIGIVCFDEHLHEKDRMIIQ